MFKLAQSENQIQTLSEVSVEGYESIPANATVPKGHRLWATYEAWLAEGNTPLPYRSEQQLLEDQRRAYKSERDQALASIVHTLSDGSVYQVRPQDISNFNLAIQEGQSEDWVLADNTIRLTTVGEMQECLASGISQGKAIWQGYTDKLKTLQ